MFLANFVLDNSTFEIWYDYNIFVIMDNKKYILALKILIKIMNR